AVRRGQQLQRLVGDAPAAAAEAEPVEDRLASLLGEPPITVERPRLRIAAGMRADGKVGHDEAEKLDDFATGAGQVGVARDARLDAGLPIDDARVEAGLARLGGQEV